MFECMGRKIECLGVSLYRMPYITIYSTTLTIALRCVVISAVLICVCVCHSVPSVLLGAGVASRQSVSSAGSGGGSGIGREASRRSSKLVLVDSLAPIAEQTAELSLKDGGDK